MDPETLELLRRGHALFSSPGAAPTLTGGDHADLDSRLARNAGVPIGGAQQIYAKDLGDARAAIKDAISKDATLRAAIAKMMAEHEEARLQSKKILDAAMADNAPAADTPMGQREAMARKAAYLREHAQLIARTRARSRASAAQLRALRYRRAGRGRRAMRLDPELLRRIPPGRGGAALKEALTQLGVTYVYGGTDWGKGIDCSSLTQGAWARAGVHIPRTTWDQINIGVAVPRSQIAVGDLVFPSSANGGHVQMYAGGGKVIEAPYTGASVRIVDMPSSIMAIRRPI
ncbi:NLP/P60 family protein [Mycobacteroides abscessus subsp. abscessus]|uniref:C40 family peptidase n=1 Tax=Mycobacteroides abscessus TaxID=36809 RepID=UPI0009A7331C|nr:C40 family peptidase [Mycobacteroides abscessus]SKO36011.1 NLP/P60 family protein [Mycobacteroides abscessus subsp. abscessus]